MFERFRIRVSIVIRNRRLERGIVSMCIVHCLPYSFLIARDCRCIHMYMHAGISSFFSISRRCKNTKKNERQSRLVIQDEDVAWRKIIDSQNKENKENKEKEI